MREPQFMYNYWDHVEYTDSNSDSSLSCYAYFSNGGPVYLLEYCSKMPNTSQKQFMLLLNYVTQKHLLFLWDIFVKLTDWTVFIQCKWIYHSCASQNLFCLDNFCNRYSKSSVGNLFAPRRELKVFIIPSNSLSYYSWCTRSN